MTKYVWRYYLLSKCIKRIFQLDDQRYPCQKRKVMSVWYEKYVYKVTWVFYRSWHSDCKRIINIIAGEMSSVDTPKEQRPRKLSGKRTVIINKIWRVVIFMTHRRGWRPYIRYVWSSKLSGTNDRWGIHEISYFKGVCTCVISWLLERGSQV